MFGAFVVFFLFQFLVVALVLIVGVLLKYGTAGARPENVRAFLGSAPNLLVSIVGVSVLVAGLALAGAWRSPVPWRERLQLRRTPLRIPMLIAGTAAIVALGAILTSLVNLGVVPRSVTIDALYHAIRGLPVTGAALAVLAVAVLPGLAEELLFRGYVQTRFVARWGSAWGIAWASVMFGVGHLDPVQGAFAVLVGAVLGFITVRTGSIVPAMICHVVNNTISTLDAVALPHVTSNTGNLVMLLVGGAALVASVLHLRTHLPAAPARPTPPETGASGKADVRPYGTDSLGFTENPLEAHAAPSLRTTSH